MIRLFARILSQKLEELPPEMKELAEKFREGIARAIGVPPEYISEEKVYRWVVNWTKAWVKPEYWSRIGLRGQGYAIPSPEEMYRLGYELGSMLRDLM